MSGDNTKGTKMLGAYDRLLCAIIEKRPQAIIDLLVFEYAACGDTAMEFEQNKKDALKQAIEDAKKYYSHRQGGRRVVVPKDSPLGRKLSKGAFSPENEDV